MRHSAAPVTGIICGLISVYRLAPIIRIGPLKSLVMLRRILLANEPLGLAELLGWAKKQRVQQFAGFFDKGRFLSLRQHLARFLSFSSNPASFSVASLSVSVLLNGGILEPACQRASGHVVERRSAHGALTFNHQLSAPIERECPESGCGGHAFRAKETQFACGISD